MTKHMRRWRAAVGRAVRSAMRQGLDPVINPEMFNAEVHERMEAWERENKEDEDDS